MKLKIYYGTRHHYAGCSYNRLLLFSWIQAIDYAIWMVGQPHPLPAAGNNIQLVGYFL